MPTPDLDSSMRAAFDRARLRHSVVASGATLVARPLGLDDPLSAYELRASQQALALEVELRPVPMGQAFVRAFRDEAEGRENELRRQVAAFGGIVRDWSVGPTDLTIRVSMPPPVRDLGIPDQELWAEVILLILRIAAAPFEESTFGSASVRRPMLENDPAPPSGGPDMIALRDGSNLHRACENSLIDHLLSHGLHPLDGTDDVQFDLAWFGADSELRICEVKSIANNPEEQVRLGIGQVSDYAARVRLHTGQRARRILCLTERPPDPPSAMAACEEAGVLVTWPTRFDDDQGVLCGVR